VDEMTGAPSDNSCRIILIRGHTMHRSMLVARLPKRRALVPFGAIHRQ
jgi:hypothetical protein